MSLNNGKEPVVLHAPHVERILTSMEDLIDTVDEAAETGNSQSIAYRQGVLDSIEIVNHMWIAACLVIGGRNRNIAVEVVD